MNSPYCFSWKETFLFGLIIIGTAVSISTEIFNLFHALDFPEIFCFWALLLITLITLLSKKIFQVRLPLFNMTVTEKILLLLLLVIIAITGFTAFYCPPNTWDALTYHIARVAHWAQNRSVNFYPTHVPRQTVSTVWLEYLALHFQILFKGDYLANSIQWVSMLGCLVGVSLIAKEFGLSTFGQLSSAVIAATIPIGILESSSMQGDYAVALWIVSAAYILISYKDLSWPKIVLFALSVSLAALTKGIGIIFSLPLLVGFSFRIRFNLIKIGAVLLIVLAINSGYLTRIHEFSPDNLLIACQVHRVSTKPADITVSTITANTLRNIGMNLGSSDDRLNKKIEEYLYAFSAFLKVDLNDPRASFDPGQLRLSRPSLDENFAINPWHTVLYLFCIVYLIVFVRNKKVWTYTLYITGMLLCLSAFVLWQPWSNRFHLPLLVLLAPVAGYVGERMRFKIIPLTIAVAFFILALPYLTDGHPRHLLGPQSFLKKSREVNLLAYSRTTSASPYSDIREKVREIRCDQIGLIMGQDDWDYAFYAFLNPHQDKSIRIEHVLVDNFTKDLPYPLGDFSPCVIIGHVRENTLTYQHRAFALIFNKYGIKMFIPKP